MAEQFVSVDLASLLLGEELPVTLYIYIDFRFITFRASGDVIDRMTFERLELKKVKNLFVHEKDRKAFETWAGQHAADKKPPPLPPENKDFAPAREDAHRKTMDIFTSAHPDRVVEQALGASKKLVGEVMKFPYAVNSLAQLQTFSRGTVDHSVNVSVLAVYLAMQMGYSHAVILQHVGLGALLHDIGKTRVQIGDEDTPEAVALKMKDHPGLGKKMLDAQTKVPNEVKMIVEQHHENWDGTGYPKKLRGNAIYDLARIVGIANTFDELVADGKGSLLERQRAAITKLDQQLYRQFDPQKLEKSLKILKMGV